MTDTAVLPSFPLDVEAARQPASDVARRVVQEAEHGKEKHAGLHGVKSLMQGRSDTFSVSPFDIHVKPGWNTRDFSLSENQEHVLDLAHSIAARGVQQPLTVYWEDGKLWLSDGECRLRGAWYAINVLNAPVMTVPVRTEPQGSNDADRVLSLLVRNSGKPLTRMEKAQTVKRLLNLGWSPEQIATESGVTVGTINGLVEVLELPEAVRQRVQQGQVAATEAVRIVKKHGEAATEIVDAAVALSGSNGNGRATRKAVERVERERTPEAKPEDAPDVVAELERAHAEIDQLNSVIDSLNRTDKDREILALQAKFAQLNGRLQQEMTTGREARQQAERYGSVLKRVRAALGVLQNADILPAIEALKN